MSGTIRHDGQEYNYSCNIEDGEGFEREYDIEILEHGLNNDLINTLNKLIINDLNKRKISFK